MRRRLGLEESDNVPADVQGLVDSAVREVAESAMATGVMRELENATRRADTSPDIEILAEAEYLAVKKKALQAAGFSNDEAMQLLVAEVTAGRAPREA
jgi:hypothetical protein